MTDLATLALGQYVRSVPRTLIPRLDISIVWSWNSMMSPPGGKFNCRIAVLKNPADYSGASPVKRAVECTRDTIEDAVLAALKEITQS